MPFDDEEEDNDGTDRPKVWLRIVVGLFGAVFIAYHARECFTTGEGTFRMGKYSGPTYVLRDNGALALGVVLTFLAIFLHFYYFWAFFPKLESIRQFFIRVSTVVCVAAMLYALFYIAAHPNQIRKASLRSAMGRLCGSSGLRHLAKWGGTLAPSVEIGLLNSFLRR